MLCQQGGYHQDEPLEMICLNNKCISSGNVLNCIVCFEEHHKGHKVIALSKLFNLIKKQEYLVSLSKIKGFLQKFRSDNYAIELSLGQNQLDNKQAERTLRDLAQTRVKYVHYYIFVIPSYQSISQITDSNLLNSLLQRVLLGMEYNPRSQSLLIRNQTLPEPQEEGIALLHKLQTINDLIENNDNAILRKGNSSRSSSINRPNRNNSINTDGYRTMRSFDRSPLSPQPFEDKLSVTQSLSNQYYRPKSLDKPLIGQPSPPPPMKEIKYQFHSEYHGVGLQISGRIAKQILNTVGCLALIGPSIYGNGIIRETKIKLLIRSCQNQNLRYPMAFGICDQKQAKQKCFQQDAENSYILNSNGYFRQYGSLLNKSKLRFYTGSTIELIFKPFQSELMVSLDDQQQLSLKMSLKSDSLLYFVVRLSDLYDCVEIL